MERVPSLAAGLVAGPRVAVRLRSVLSQGAAGERHAQLRSAQLLHPPPGEVVVRRRPDTATLKLEHTRHREKL